MQNQPKTLALIGFGDLGLRVLLRMNPESWICIGMCRHPEKVPEPGRGLAIDLQRPETLAVLGELRPDALLVTLTPTDRTVAGYRQGFAAAMDAVIDGLGGHRPDTALFVSSTRVYAERDGGWVDEDSPLASEPQAQAIASAERSLFSCSDNSRILRAGGLYTDQSRFLLARVQEGRFTPTHPERFSNRIHRDDVARFIHYALENRLHHHVYNLVDNDPASLQEVEAWLSQHLGVRYCPGAQASESPSHKRISNARLRGEGFRLEHPDYRSGYSSATP
ncbi:MAG: epimerase [Pseudomonadota bacterium]